MISILATADGSPESLAVIPALEKLAGDVKARVQLLTVVERPRGTTRRSVEVPRGNPAYGFPGTTLPAEKLERAGWAESPEQALTRAIDEGRDFLRMAAQPLEAQGLEVETDVVIDNNVSKAIVNYARRNKFDLIAMATHGRSGLSDLVQGSVATAVVSSGVAPVLLIRPSKAQVRSYRATLKKASSDGVLRLQPM